MVFVPKDLGNLRPPYKWTHTFEVNGLIESNLRKTHIVTAISPQRNILSFYTEVEYRRGWLR